MAIKMTQTQASRRAAVMGAIRDACAKSKNGWITLGEFKRSTLGTFSPPEVDRHVTSLHDEGHITVLKVGRSIRLILDATRRNQAENDVSMSRYKVIFINAEYRIGVELEKECQYWLSTYNAYELNNVVSLSLSGVRKNIKGILLFLRLRDDSLSAAVENLDTEWWGD